MTTMTRIYYSFLPTIFQKEYNILEACFLKPEKRAPTFFSPCAKGIMGEFNHSLISSMMSIS